MSKNKQNHARKQQADLRLMEKLDREFKRKQTLKRLVALAVCALLLLGIVAMPLFSML